MPRIGQPTNQEVDDSKKKIEEIENKMNRSKRVAKYYEEARESGMQHECDKVKLGALNLK